MPKHVVSAFVCALLATSVAATFNAAHGELVGHPPRVGAPDGILAQVSDALIGGDRRTFIDLAKYLNELPAMR